ncbi:MAG: AbrB/MazE/SpoVT family DNA-binding domain-containing protein [Nanoarchaeota archaeon]|nr:AbrB/MazE/SpoVT family DNA-binding domain-containing protein [Nanoarchaeota archaeon]MBU1031008.1 AbrB/MazE/SpoVT family DNA-binding domain-containing protein [Nanoarchaeota archaeon]MBU1849458.1 AbrB/MazE/SpoVT family DNA-binding domain-containing protein [Nanoarchaeota archaeon]
MEVALTKISRNGQVVIPSEVRRDAGIKPATQFLVFNEDGNILLKQIKKESLRSDMLLIDKIKRSEDEIKDGKFIKVDTKISDEEIDDLLMG